MEKLQALFAEKLVVDDREPITTLNIPGLEGEFGLYSPRAAVWNQLLLLVLLQTVLQCAFASVIYTCIVKHRKTTFSYLIGYGAVIPLALYMPYEILEFLDVQNKIVRLSLVTLGTVVGFRTMEAMYGTSPATVESSLGTYVTYYSSLMHFEWDPKTKMRRKIKKAELIATVTKIFVHYHLVSLLMSIELHYDFQPFESTVQLDGFNLRWDLLSVSHLLNVYVLAGLTYLVLCTGFELTAFAENAKGFYTKPIFLNPLFSSRNPSKFWGQRWNLMIHRILKHGAYLPARLFVSKQIAIALTFCASGLLHDYTWSLVFYHHTSKRDETGVCPECFTPYPLKLTAFFLWNGVVMLLERPVGKLFWFTSNWPTPIVCTLMLLTALPISHWYTGDWAVGGYFADFSLALWHIRKL